MFEECVNVTNKIDETPDFREPGNRHDDKAIRVEWQGRLLGYVPRADNPALAAAMDAGERLSGRVAHILDDADPWRRLRFDIYLDF